MILFNNLTTKIKGIKYTEFTLDFKFDAESNIDLNSKEHIDVKDLYIQSFVEGLRLTLNASLFSDKKDFYLFNGTEEVKLYIPKMFITDIEINNEESKFSIVFNLETKDIKSLFGDSVNPNSFYKKIIENYCISEGMYSEMNYYKILKSNKYLYLDFIDPKTNDFIISKNFRNLNSSCRKTLEIKNLFNKEDIFENILTNVGNKSNLIVINNRIFSLYYKNYFEKNEYLLKDKDITYYTPSNFIKEFLIDHEYLYEFSNLLDDRYVLTETNSKFNMFNSNEVKNINISIIVGDNDLNNISLFETSI